MSTPAKKRPKSARRKPSLPLQFLKEPSPALFPSKDELPRLFAVISIASTVALACNYAATVFNRPPKPFCDTDGAFDSSLSDFCDPCPRNAECSNGMWECLHGFRKQGKVCVEDVNINQTAKEILEWVEHRLCEAYARVLCYGTGSIWFQETEIFRELDENKFKINLGSKDDTFMYARKKASEIIETSLEKRTAINGITEFKCPDWLAEQYKPLHCCVQQWIYKHALLILPVSALLVGLVRFLWRIRQSQNMACRADQVYEQVCDILEENAVMTKTSSNEGEPWVVASWLRDHLLQPKERKNIKLWKKVEELVQEDSRVDQYPKLVKGESKIVWEWQVEGSLSSRMRSKKAASKTKSGDIKIGGSSSTQLQKKMQFGELLNG